MSDLDFSFCIITDNSHAACLRIVDIVKSIRNLQIPNYEILVIGGEIDQFESERGDFKKINFDESQKPGWITKKKNVIAEIAKYENLVIMHDYFVFHRNWYKGYLKVYDQFMNCDVCCNPIYMIDDRRDPTDWMTWYNPNTNDYQQALNYNDLSMIKHQYISGGYFLVKKQFFIENPLDETLTAHEQEDVEWSMRIRDKAKIYCNPFSYVKHNKEHRNLRINIWSRLI